MLFNSLAFLIFAVAFYLLWKPLKGNDTSRWLYLVAASFFFYGWWDWRFLFLLIGSGLIDFIAGLAIDRFPARRRLFLIGSIIGNIGSLGVFKYSGFLARNLDVAIGWLGLSTHFGANMPDFLLIVPVGISFYTFQSLSYTIDVYRGNLKPTRNVFHFFAYISLFPQLVAGPIVRANQLLPQLTQMPRATDQQRWDGLRLIIFGFFKKVVIADNVAPLVNYAFGSPTPETSTIFWWIVITMFAFQIYCDFSGYSDIAIGLAKWMGYEFEPNFVHPYISRSLREFWTRWHISLSSWFKDYVYIPLGGSKLGKFAEYRNLWATILISGLWHGAAWTFVVWAAVHAFFLSLEKITQWPARLGRTFGGGLLATSLVLMQVWVAWVFFRAGSLNQAAYIVSRMFSFDFSMFHIHDVTLWLTALSVTALAAGRELYLILELDKRMPAAKLRPIFEQVSIAVMLAACVYFRGPGSAFIYFQF